ncbi:MAG: lipoprotein-releasing system ATP-binding protein LolD [Actinobacteria bacterium HGW-Actinobacteria-7]|jgi:lipoprotein-releasing system ATP-binding protein|nr:MAG: lipoprotein-releasing system ATP-binding protein LolD [Actinobacteria bacterium HGW-Actinobacteria-7]
MAEKLLVADSLDKVYGTGEGATHALRGVSFELNEGEFAAIVGQSGSGKSTLLNMVGLLDTPTAGEVRFRGRNAEALPRPELARMRNELIGFVFQFHYLLPEFSVFENVAMPAFIGGTLAPGEIQARAEEALALLGLEGLEGKNANQLSGGQKQRVAIARALMNRPALLLADEPTGNLDTVNTDLVYDLFRKISAETGTAFMIVTHDRGVAQRTDRILEVTDGRLVQDIRNDYARAT